MKGYIYKFENKINNKIYIGQTIRKPNIRYREHIKGHNSKNSLIHKAIVKYGIDNFTFSIIEEIEDEKENLIDRLNKLEIYYIEQNQSLYPNGYNISKGGNNNSFRHIDRVLIENEPIINTETGYIYKDIREWLIKENLSSDCQCDLYLDPKFKYRFVNQSKIRYFGECYPENATIEDVLTGKAKPFVRLPIPDNEFSYTSQVLEKIELQEKLLKEQEKLISYLKELIIQLKEENRQIKEHINIKTQMIL